MGATKIQGGLGEQERELKAEHVGVTHSALLGKQASPGPIRTTAVQIWNQETTEAKRSLSCQLWRPSVTGS